MLGPLPPPSGGLPGTLNSDEARDLDLPMKDRFYLQPVSPVEAAKRAKESAKDILRVKELIDKKAWPFVRNDLRLKASYLRFDLNTIISSAKSKEEKKLLKELTGKLFVTIDELDHAAKVKSKAESRAHTTKPSSPANPFDAEPVLVMNGTVEVRRPGDMTVFEFGSGGDSVTLAGYYQVSDELQPCKWALLNASGPEVPLFRCSFRLRIYCL
ncbi:hypothetical protein J5N97_011615 [Dioscorea zingiberensis]|uniref:Uncharacterized protein n=1 Tax=Dioscorea zingiberensis TaxID=325984 RepID=A0A9D5D0P3_9LILI|nr:hypothetical protein J5N97_011615 [Dioscorea zingiberensis]